MKLSFDVRLCVRPSSVFSTIVEYIPLTRYSPFGTFCTRWSPPERQGTRICLCSLLLMAFSLISYIHLLLASSAATETNTGQRIQKKRQTNDVPNVCWRYWPYPQIIWQTHFLMAMVYVVTQCMSYRGEDELIHLVPLCLGLFCGDFWYTLSASKMTKNPRKRIVIMYRMIQWVALVGNLTCALHHQYAECKFVD